LFSFFLILKSDYGNTFGVCVYCTVRTGVMRFHVVFFKTE
jgi:hypothetical protein